MTGWIMGSAIWLGILTSISPCPLASNIAAISFVSRNAHATRQVFLAGLLYTLGRALAYIAVAGLIVAGLAAMDEVARFLQRYMNQLLGPVLILVGLVLLGGLTGSASINLAGERVQKQAEKGGAVWALPLGILFALSFCPVSAGLFFGGLIPLALQAESRILVPALFGLGTALPVLVFAFLVAFASQYVGRVFDRLTRIEKGMRVGVGTVFIVAGLYYCLTHIYRLGF